MLAVGIFWLGVLLAVLAILMLFWDSFKTRKLWALAGLIFIVPLLIHMLMSWSVLNVRKAFYVLTLGILSVVVSIAGGALTSLPFLSEHEVIQVLEENIAPPKQEEPLPNQQQADQAAQAVEDNYDPLLTGSEYEDLQTKEIVLENDIQIDPNKTSAKYQSIGEGEYQYALNKWVRLKLSDAKAIEGRLTNILEDAVLVETTVNGGALGLSYKKADIVEMLVRLEVGEVLIPVEEESLQQDQIDTEDITETGQQILSQQADTTAESEVNTEILEPEIEVLDEDIDQPATEQVLEKIETIVDDSKSLEQPIGQ